MKQKTKPSKPSQPKNVGGRPEYVPTAEQKALVEALTGYGIPQDEIVKLVINPQTGNPISQTTLRSHFERELEQGLLKANARVMGALFKNATTQTDRYPGGIPVAQIFWLKTRGGGNWNTSQRIIVESPQAQIDPESQHAQVARRILFALELAARTAPIDVTPKKVAG